VKFSLLNGPLLPENVVLILLLNSKNSKVIARGVIGQVAKFDTAEWWPTHTKLISLVSLHSSQEVDVRTVQKKFKVVIYMHCSV